MKSPEDIQQIPQIPPEPESEKERQWLEKLVASGQYSSPEEARADMQKLLDSVVSPESNINKLIDQKIEEIIELDSPLINDLERETVIIQKLTEIFQEHPELLKAERYGLNLSDSQWREKGVLLAEHRETYSFMLRALHKLADRYEKDPLRKKLSITILEILLSRKQEVVRSIFMEGGIPEYGEGIEYEYDQFPQLSKEAQDLTPRIRSLLQNLSKENAQEIQQAINDLIQESKKEISTQYPYLNGVIRQMEHRYAHEDEAKRLAVHTAATGSIDLNALRMENQNDRLDQMLLFDVYEIKEILGLYSLIVSKSLEQGALLTREDVGRPYGPLGELQKTLVGKTSQEAQQYLLDKLKSF